MPRLVPSSKISLLVFVCVLQIVNSRRQRHHRYKSFEGGGKDALSYFRDPYLNIRRSVPDEPCPIRNDAQVRSLKLTCMRRCVIDADCQNDRKLCLCDGPCGMSCIRPEKECPELADPLNGQVHLPGRHFQDKASYTCNEGFQLVGLQEQRCSASGRWTGMSPICKEMTGGMISPYYCGTPPHIQNSFHNGSGEQVYWDLDTELTYQCDPGFKRDGFDNAKCFYMNGTATWYGPDLTCKPIECGPPDVPRNGKKSISCTSYRCQVKYTCLPGFILRGQDTKICERDGLWTQTVLPECEAVQCGVPRNPENGRALFTSLSYKSVVTYECNYGYMIVGDGNRTCESDRNWSGGQPECKEINCGAPGGGHLPNGWLEGSRTSMHSVVFFKCLEGMVIEGANSTTCGPGGRWSHQLPKCLAPCIIPEIEHGQSNNSIGSKITHGMITTILCDEQFEVYSNVTPIQCNNGTWSMIPKCFPARCKTMPAPPKNGMIVVPMVTHGSTGLYQCKDGYRLVGDHTTKCNFGNWSASTPKCEEIFCPFPGYLPNGKVLLVGNMGLYDYRPYVKRISNDRQIMFDCDREYRIERGPRGATCVDGKWSPDYLPICVPDNHPNIRWLDKRSIKDSELEEVVKELEKSAKSAKEWSQGKKKRIKRSLERHRRKDRGK